MPTIVPCLDDAPVDPVSHEGTDAASGFARSSFATARGARESFILIRSDRVPFPEVLAQMVARYDLALATAGLSDDTVVYSRVFVSDPANRGAQLRTSPLFARLRAGAVSVIGQAPLGSGPLCLLSYHVQSRGARYQCRVVREVTAHNANQDGRHGALLHLRNYRMLWNAGFVGRGAGDASSQTDEILWAVSRSVMAQNMSLLDATVRTWICVRDIDNNYRAMVGARRKFFATHGLQDNTRYLASTGIEGTAERTASLVAVDALSIDGLAAGQVQRMDALSHMPRTIDYGVTFERGLRVRFGDRSHLYVSGTASIDHTGASVYPGNARAQTLRAIENVSALLALQGASLNDLEYVLVYVRDRHELAAVENALSASGLDDIPKLLLHAAVCRPAWLVELEGRAIIADATKFLPFD